MSKPRIAVTMGDPSGVGPEIAIKALLNPSVRDLCLPYLVGDYELICRLLPQIADIECANMVARAEDEASLKSSSAAINVLDLKNVPADTHRFGVVSRESGKCAGEYIETACNQVQSGFAQAMVTCPINKEAFRLAGYSDPGHTEFLARLTGSGPVSLMLMHGNFRVVHVTLHTALSDVPSLLSEDKICETIRIAHEGCKSLGIPSPKIGVAGLNPHAGEAGLFGNEEKDIIEPAVLKMKNEGIKVEGPFSSDGIFAMLKGGAFDIVVCMYHDQGGVPMKLLSFDWDNTKKCWSSVRGVNVTLGLPIIRTSVAHGTAFEAAGKGSACADSLIEAIETAALMARSKQETYSA